MFMKDIVAKTLSILGFSLSFLNISQVALAQTSITIDHTTAGSLQSYTVPSGFVRAALTARGADGGIGTGNARSGSGATATAIISIIAGNVFNSVIGEAGQGNTNDGGGGGGTGLCLGSTLIIVGGGGGGADNTDNAAGGAINGGNDINNGRDGYSRRTLQPLGGTPANIAQAGENSGTDIAAGAGGAG